jgi:5S rRNA maturation endonuclease (ribonuclease M5)
MGINDFKLYFPLRDRKLPYPKFITNCDVVAGFNYTPKDMDYALITKSYKDFMSLYSYIFPINNKVGIYSLSSENTPISKEDYTSIVEKVNTNIRNTDTKSVFTLLDFDLTGVRMSNKMRKDFKTIPFFLTDGRFYTVDYEGKDFTDVLIEKGKDFIESLVNNTLVEINKLIER